MQEVKGLVDLLKFECVGHILVHLERAFKVTVHQLWNINAGFEAAKCCPLPRTACVLSSISSRTIA